MNDGNNPVIYGPDGKPLGPSASFSDPKGSAGEAVTPQADPHQKSGQANPNVVVSSQNSPSPSTQDQTYQGPQRTPRWKVIVEYAAIAIAFGLLIVNIIQACVNNEAANAARDAANAAQSAAGTAKTSLYISGEAILVVSNESVDLSAKTFNFDLSNIGHLPVGQFNVITHVALLSTPTPRSYYIDKDTIEYYWTLQTLPGVAPNTPAHLHGATLQELNADLLKQGKQVIVTAGMISYNDGFPGTPIVTLPYCFQTVVQGMSKQLMIGACNPDEIAPQLSQLDRYDPKSRRY